jgi:glycosyltransferase involved in cell wall biosynthesis
VRTDNKGGRVLVSAHTYQPEGVSEGWTAAQLVTALRSRGRRMTVVTAALPKMKRQYGVLGIRCTSKSDTSFISVVNYSEFALRSLFLGRPMRDRFSVVHHVSPMIVRLPSILGAMGRPFIWGPVGGSIPYPPGFEQYARLSTVTNAMRSLDRPRLRGDPTMIFTMRSADRIVVTTSMAAESIPERYRRKVMVIPEGIPESLLVSEPPGEECYIFSSGRLVDYKAMDLLIRAFARVRHGAVRLIITGDGPNKTSLLALISKLGLQESVQMRGRVPRDENQRLMSRSLFCVFPAIREAFGHVNLEAMAAWKPVVVSDWGGPRDLVDNEVTGLKVLGRNPDEHIELLAAAIQRLLDDGEMRRRMGAAAFARVRKTFTWRELAARYDSLYDELSDAL